MAGAPFSGNLGLDQRAQQGSHRGNAIQAEARPGRARTYPNGDRVGGQGRKEVFIGAIVSDREHGGGRQSLRRERRNDPAFVDAVGANLQYLVPGEDLYRLIAQ